MNIEGGKISAAVETGSKVVRGGFFDPAYFDPAFFDTLPFTAATSELSAGSIIGGLE